MGDDFRRDEESENYQYQKDKRTEHHAFNIKTKAQRDLIKHQQADEYLHIDKHHEGLCWYCFSDKYIFPVVVDCCRECLAKMGGLEGLLGIGLSSPGGYCFIHNGPAARLDTLKNLFQINCHMCIPCWERLTTKERRENGAEETPDSLRRRTIKDPKEYMEIMEQLKDQNRRKAWAAEDRTSLYDRDQINIEAGISRR